MRRYTPTMWWLLPLHAVIWMATLHWGFDLGRYQGWPHGFIHDVLPASIGLGFMTGGTWIILAAIAKEDLQ